MSLGIRIWHLEFVWDLGLGISPITGGDVRFTQARNTLRCNPEASTPSGNKRLRTDVLSCAGESHHYAVE
jgi:hypothetical protein